MTKKQSDTLSIRFSGENQMSFLKEVEELALRTGGKPGPFVRNLAIIGYAFFKKGANLGFDGEVVMNGTTINSTTPNEPIPEPYEIKPSETNSVINEPLKNNKKNTFVD